MTPAEQRKLDKQTRKGNALIQMLGLKIKKDGRVKTVWGDKSPLGLCISVEAIMKGTP